MVHVGQIDVAKELFQDSGLSIVTGSRYLGGVIGDSASQHSLSL